MCVSKCTRVLTFANTHTGAVLGRSTKLLVYFLFFYFIVTGAVLGRSTKLFSHVVVSGHTILSDNVEVYFLFFIYLFLFCKKFPYSLIVFFYFCKTISLFSLSLVAPSSLLVYSLRLLFINVFSKNLSIAVVSGRTLLSDNVEVYFFLGSSIRKCGRAGARSEIQLFFILC